jgi:broad specificity phosphatase PhoE
MTKLILVRHGHTIFNRPGEGERLRAWKDIPLSELGLQEAGGIAERLVAQPVDFIITSDLLRARQTAEAISAATQAPIISTPSLRPWHLGSLAGQRVADVLDMLNQLQRDPDLPAPEGESLNEFFHRFSVHLRALLAIAERSRRCIVAVTHVRNFLAIPVVLSGGPATGVGVKGGPKTASILTIEKRRKKWEASPLVESSAVSRDRAADPVRLIS